MKQGTIIEVYTDQYPPVMDIVTQTTPRTVSCTEDLMAQTQSVKWDNARKFLLSVHLPTFRGLDSRLQDGASKLEDTVQKNKILGDSEKPDVEEQSHNRKGSKIRSSTELASVPEEQEPQEDLIDMEVSEVEASPAPQETKGQRRHYGSDLLCFAEENSHKPTDAGQMVHEQLEDLIDLGDENGEVGGLDDRAEGSEQDRESNLLIL